MAGVLKGRYMADVSRLGDEVVVFVIGMRINKPLKVGLWWPVFNGMGKMLKYLAERPEKGLLAYRVSALPPFVLQYWRSFDDLERFARNISYFTCTLSEARKKPDPPVNNGANTASGLGCNNPVSVNARSRVVSLSDLTSHLGA